MQRTKRHRTNFISFIIFIVTVGVLVFLAIVLYNHVNLEIRFNTIINWLKKIDNAVALNALL